MKFLFSFVYGALRAFIWFLAMVILFSISYWLSSCNASKKSAAEKEYEARLARIKLLDEARQMWPCDTTTRIIVQSDTVFQYMRKDSVVYLSKDDSIVYINRYNTITNTVTKTITVVDRAEIQAARDSIDNISFLFDACVGSESALRAERDRYKDELAVSKPWKTYFFISLGGLVLAAAVGLYFRFRNSIKI